MQKVKWLQYFDLSESTLESWLIDKPKDVTITSWCLEKGYLDSQKYLDWAKSHYELPIMNSNYETFEIDPQFWQQVKAVANWSEEFLPLYLWENNIFVLSAEPLEMDWSFPVKYVIGSPQQLKFFWRQIIQNQESKQKDLPVPLPKNPAEKKELKPSPELKSKKVEPANKPTNMPELPKMPVAPPEKNADDEMTDTGFTGTNIVTVADLNKLDEISQIRKEKELKERQEKPIPQPPAPAVAPVVMKKSSEDSPPAFSIDSLQDHLEGGDGPPTGLSNAPTTTTTSFTEVPEGLSLGSDVPPSITSTEEVTEMNTMEVPEGLSEILEDSVFSKELPLTQTKAPIHTASVQRLENIDEPLKKPPMSPPTSPPTQKPVITTSKSEPTVIGPAFEKIKKDFEQFLVLQLNGRNLTLNQSHMNWPLTKKNFHLELNKKPNLFNFCLLSKKSFHGPVSNKDSMKVDLFSALDINGENAHITVTPVVTDTHQVEFFVVALGQEENLEILSSLEGQLKDIKNALTA